MPSIRHLSCSITSVYRDQNQCRCVTGLTAVAEGSSLIPSLRGVLSISIDQPVSNSLRVLEEASLRRPGSHRPPCFFSSSCINSGWKLEGSASSTQASRRLIHSARESPSRMLLLLDNKS